MPRRTFCEHDNPPGADRCAHCGAALTSIAESREEDQSAVPLADRAASQQPSHLSGELAEQVESLLRRGNLIGAIKVYREHTGRGLKESKDAVEAFARQRNIPVFVVGIGTTLLGALLFLPALLQWREDRMAASAVTPG